jgi:serine/threonine-protein phosphatase 6 regulatory ankyrin repeat subunit B
VARIRQDKTSAATSTRRLKKVFATRQVATLKSQETTFTDLIHLQELGLQQTDLERMSIENSSGDAWRKATVAVTDPVSKRRVQIPVQIALRHAITTAYNEAALAAAVNAGASVTAAIEENDGAAIEENDGYTALHLAAEIGNIDAMGWLVTHGADLNAKDKAGSSVLHCVVEGGRLEAISWLIAQGADVNAEEMEGAPVLHYAAYCNPPPAEPVRLGVQVIELLVGHGADVNAVDNKGITVLHKCAMYGQILEMEWLVGHGVDVNVVDKIGNNALHCAAGRGHVDVIRWLLENNGVGVGVVDNAGRTALSYAAQGGNVEVIGCLLGFGANANAAAESGDTPLIFAASYPACSDDAPLEAGHRHGRLGAMERLVTKGGADVNAIGEKGMTALHHAAERGSVYAVRWLLQQGSNVHATDENGRTVLHCACTYR